MTFPDPAREQSSGTGTAEPVLPVASRLAPSASPPGSSWHRLANHPRRSAVTESPVLRATPTCTEDAAIIQIGGYARGEREEG
jgi:hypothetical protein